MESHPRRRRAVALGLVLVVVGGVLAWPLIQHVWIGWSLSASEPVLPPLVNVPAFSSRALEAMFRADQAGRLEPIDWDRLRVEDAQRRQIVRAWLSRDLIREPRDRFHAAMVFQHGRSVDDFALAHELARSAAEAGYRPARWLKAATEDRLRLARGQRQKYGTQFQQGADGRWRLSPVDPGVDDAERARWDVPPLAEAQADAAAMNDGGR